MFSQPGGIGHDTGIIVPSISWKFDSHKTVA